MTWAKRRAIVIIILVVFFVVVVLVASRPTALRLPSNAVLVIDAMGQIEEQRAPDIFSAFSGTTTPVLHDYVDAIDTAANDPRITGLVVRIAPLETGWGKLEEIRAHLVRLGIARIQQPEGRAIGIAAPGGVLLAETEVFCAGADDRLSFRAG